MTEPEELSQVIVGVCGCVLPADSLPVGFRFVATGTGDRRVLVYACADHSHLTAPITKPPKPRRRSPRPSSTTAEPTAPDA